MSGAAPAPVIHTQAPHDWDAYVRARPDASIYLLSGWALLARERNVAQVPADRAPVNDDTPIALFVNGQKRQSATLGEMVHSVPEIIAALSKLYELKAGDLIYTGTPAGVAALQRGDRFEATLGNIVSLEGRIT